MKLSLFNTVKTYVDRLDRMGLLDMGAPKDEYDPESRMISERITEGSTADDIAGTIAEVFSEMFMLNDDKDVYGNTAEQIYNALHP